LLPGPGVGGQCIDVGPLFIVAAAPDTATIIRNARESNDAKPEWVVNQVKAAAFDVLQETGRAPVVATLGLAFKPNIDDLRESPALNITEALSDEFTESKILSVEPHIDELPERLQGRDNLTLTEVNEAIDRADIIVLLVDHAAFKDLGPAAYKKRVLDTRGQWRSSK